MGKVATFLFLRKGENKLSSLSWFGMNLDTGIQFLNKIPHNLNAEAVALFPVGAFHRKCNTVSQVLK